MLSASLPAAMARALALPDNFYGKLCRNVLMSCQKKWQLGRFQLSSKAACRCVGRPSGCTARTIDRNNRKRKRMYSSSLVRRLLPAALVVVAASVSLPSPRNAVVKAQEVQSAPVGVLSFTDITAAAGMASSLSGSHGAFWADATGDGRPDLFLTYN